MPLRLLLLLALALPLHAAVDLRRGSVAVLAQSATVQLQVPAAAARVATGEELPAYYGGVFNVRSAEPGELFLRTSNGIDLYFRGPGFFGVERFDKTYPASSGIGIGEELQSRLIMNLRQGSLVVDNEGISEDAQIILETPFGRIYAPLAEWSIAIEFDRRSRIYDFTIVCAEGSLRLTDRLGENYVVFAGQRLAGAGTYMNPAVEIGEPTDRDEERFESFHALRGRLPTDDLNDGAFRSAMLDLPEQAETDAASRTSQFPNGVQGRPLIIEYAPPPPLLTPFRGTLRPPSDFQADIF